MNEFAEFEAMPDTEISPTLRKLSDKKLLSFNKSTAEKSRKITLLLLLQLNEVERRHLYSKFRVSSLHAYCVHELKMDDGTAGRHVSAARLLREVPSIEEKIVNGTMSLTSVSQPESSFEKKQRQETRSASRKKLISLPNLKTNPLAKSIGF